MESPTTTDPPPRESILSRFSIVFESILSRFRVATQNRFEIPIEKRLEIDSGSPWEGGQWWWEMKSRGVGCSLRKQFYYSRIYVYVLKRIHCSAQSCSHPHPFSKLLVWIFSGGTTTTRPFDSPTLHILYLS